MLKRFFFFLSALQIDGSGWNILQLFSMLVLCVMFSEVSQQKLRAEFVLAGIVLLWKQTCDLTVFFGAVLTLGS